MTAGAKRRVLYAHPDRWTINAEFPPEERERMHKALKGFAVEWLRWKGTVKLTAPEGSIEESDAQRDAVAAFRSRRKAFGTRARRVEKVALEATVGAALDAVLTGALWESPHFIAKDGGALAFHRAWRVVLDLGPRDERALPVIAKRFSLIVRAR